jgi:hypothetical protein
MRYSSRPASQRPVDPGSSRRTSPSKESRKPPRGLDLRPPSRVRLCSVFKEPVPSSGGFPVSREPLSMSSAFFPRRLGRRLGKACLFVLEVLFAGKIGPGHRRGREDTEPGRGCQGVFFDGTKKSAPGPSSRPSRRGGEGQVRATRRPAGAGPGAREASDSDPKKPPIPLRDKGFPPPHVPD